MSKHNPTAVVSQQQVMVHSGPLPDPATLEKYNRIVSNAADRIIAMAETEMQHRHDMDNKHLQLQERKLELDEKALKAQIEHSNRGQICATVSSVATIIAGAYEAVYGNPWQGIAVGLAGILVPAAVFVYNKEACIRELKEKQKLMNQIQ